jgi:tetratricopeptide (TPR) repeat protein
MVGVWFAGLLSALLAPGPAAAQGRVAAAEEAARAAVELASSDPAAAVAAAREALALTGEFEPTAFVDAGRKGEVVEDAFLAARQTFREHRSKLYQAVGETLSAAGEPAAAARYLRRARLLDPRGGAALPLAKALVAVDLGREALDALSIGERPLSREELRVAEAAADAARLPSLQVEIDRRRLAAVDVEPELEFKPGPFTLERGSRLSTGRPLSFGPGLSLLYVGDVSCRSCSADLETIARLASEGIEVVMAPSDPEEDYALRQAVQVYRYPWPFLVRSSLVSDQGFPAPSAVVIARQGWVAAIVRPPLDFALPAALRALRSQDVQESLPRARWDRKPVTPWKPFAPPEALPEGLIPGEDSETPQAFADAVAAFRAGRFSEAERLFDQLEAVGDGWLLPPEAALNRALCLAGRGRREVARRILLRIGDSRVQEQVDRALEQVGSGGAP